MANRVIRLKDKVGTQDSSLGGLYGEIIFGKGLKKIPYIDPYGHKSFHCEFEEETYHDHNIVPIGGYQFVFDKLFNIGLDQESTLRVGDLNDEAPQMKIGVPKYEYKSPMYNAETSIGGASVPTMGGINISALNFVFGFMVGNGGAREDNVTPIAPDYKNRMLYNAIPFRMSNDKFPFEEGRYFGKTNGSANSADVTSYYVKKFDNPAPHIVHKWASENNNEFEVVDDSVFASTATIPIESYVEMNISLTAADCRGFATMNDEVARVNEFALVSGWYNSEKKDYEALRLFTKFTRPSITLLDGDSIEAIYRLYAR